MRNKTLFPLLVIGLAALMMTACATPFAQAAPNAQATEEAPPEETGTNQTAPRTLSINGHGEVTLTPDIAYIYVGVHTENENAADAVAACSRRPQRRAAHVRRRSPRTPSRMDP